MKSWRGKVHFYETTPFHEIHIHFSNEIQSEFIYCFHQHIIKCLDPREILHPIKPPTETKTIHFKLFIKCHLRKHENYALRFRNPEAQFATLIGSSLSVVFNRQNLGLLSIEKPSF